MAKVVLRGIISSTCPMWGFILFTTLLKIGPRPHLAVGHRLAQANIGMVRRQAAWVPLLGPRSSKGVV